MNEANNQGKGWTLGEDRTVANMHEDMQSLHSIAARLGRTELAIRYRLEKLGCKPRKIDVGYGDVYVKPAVGKSPTPIAAYGGNLRENMVQALTFRGVPLEWDCGDQYREERSNGDTKGLEALIDDSPGHPWRTSIHSGHWSGKHMTATMEKLWRECTKYPKPDLIPISPFMTETVSNSVAQQFPEIDFAEIESRVNAYTEQRLKDINGAAEVIRRAGWVVVDEVGTKAHIDTETFSSFCPPPRARFGNGPWNDGVTYFLNETGLNALNLEKTKMSKKFFETRKQILVNGCVHTEQEIKDNAAAFARMIQTEDTQIKALESITAQTKALKREIEERRANLQEFVTFVDSLEPSDDAKTGA